VPAVREKLVSQSLYPVDAPEPCGDFLAAQTKRYAGVLQRAGAK
jgi:hypothetical protein